MQKSLPGKELLPPSPLLRLTDVVQSGTDWIVRADGPDWGTYPNCGGRSVPRHSHYIRTLTDLPALGATVSLKIRVGRWRCFTLECAVRFFIDRLPGVADFGARRTCRANEVAQLIGYALGGRPGERLSRRIGLPVSNDTVLRQLEPLPLNERLVSPYRKPAGRSVRYPQSTHTARLSRPPFPGNVICPKTMF
jgi:hypothetical protein